MHRAQVTGRPVKRRWGTVPNRQPHRELHVFRHWSTTQATVSLSSAEAEPGGIRKGSSICFGLISIALDLGIDRSLEMQTDATAAVGICRRMGLGKIRHLATADLWIQDKIRCGSFALTKIPGSANPSDILTKKSMFKCKPTPNFSAIFDEFCSICHIKSF